MWESCSWVATWSSKYIFNNEPLILCIPTYAMYSEIKLKSSGFSNFLSFGGTETNDYWLWVFFNSYLTCCMTLLTFAISTFNFLQIAYGLSWSLKYRSTILHTFSADLTSRGFIITGRWRFYTLQPGIDNDLSTIISSVRLNSTWAVL